MDDSIYIPISKPEFTILNSAFNVWHLLSLYCYNMLFSCFLTIANISQITPFLQFIVPYLLGWHFFANAIKPENSLRMNSARSSVDYELGKWRTNLKRKKQVQSMNACYFLKAGLVLSKLFKWSSLGSCLSVLMLLGSCS